VLVFPHRARRPRPPERLARPLQPRHVRALARRTHSPAGSPSPSRPWPAPRLVTFFCSLVAVRAVAGARRLYTTARARTGAGLGPGGSQMNHGRQCVCVRWPDTAAGNAMAWPSVPSRPETEIRTARALD
jgi:hypothetical protein